MDDVSVTQKKDIIRQGQKIKIAILAYSYFSIGEKLKPPGVVAIPDE